MSTPPYVYANSKKGLPVEVHHENENTFTEIIADESGGGIYAKFKWAINESKSGISYFITNLEFICVRGLSQVAVFKFDPSSKTFNIILGDATTKPYNDTCYIEIEKCNTAEDGYPTFVDFNDIKLFKPTSNGNVIIRPRP